MVAIFVALMFVGLVLLDLVVQRLDARRAEGARSSASAEIPRASRPLLPWMVPPGVYVSLGHAWVSPQSGEAFGVGADSLVSQAVGTLTRVIPPRLGDQVSEGEPLFHLELDNRILTVHSPVTGKVASLNVGLQARPELVTEDPYGKGWICSIAPTRPSAKWKGMLSGERATAWLESEFNRFREFVVAQISPDPALGFVSQDGGMPAPGLLRTTGVGIWSAFEREFLQPPGEGRY